MDENLQQTRSIPQNTEAEQSVLGAMIIDNDTISSVVEVINADDFYRNDHKLIFTAIESLYNVGETIDLITLTDKLEKSGALEKAGGIEYITVLATSVPNIANAERYAGIVKEKSILRTLIKITRDIQNRGYKANDDAKKVLEYAEESIFSMLSGNKKGSFLPMNEVVLSTIRKIEKAYHNQGKISGIPTGFRELDRLLSGLHGSDLVLIAARPAMGKTAFALNIAENAAIKNNKHTAIFSLEMSKEQLLSRIMASNTNIDSEKLRDGTLNEEEWVRLVDSVAVISAAPMYIDDTAGITVTEIRAKCRNLKLRGELDLIVIDYLQLIQSSGRDENRQNEIARITRSLKILAKDLNVPIVCLSQLSREADKRTGSHKPVLSDLRDSGAIEQDADIVMFIYREGYYNSESENPEKSEIIVAKHRNGSTGSIELVFRGRYTKFLDVVYSR